jgi:F-type H+-transporting ATPase subunit b
MEIITNTELVSINATMLAQLVSFLIFLFLITRIMIRPLLETVTARREHLQKLQKEIAASSEELSQATARVRQEQAALRAEAFAESEQLESSGKREAKGILRQARAEIAALKDQTLAEAGVRIETAKGELARDIEPIVAAIMEKILERRVRT